ncbi:phosphonate metabolism transcriptional regulator PhnF [Aurantimonas sp. 22II-16-19i]|uniref:phosphonate metabolism transcriptional regulator PhnF n=1 Tax=Aurantimonas sp. 22II-16-19i TaxID=1317114 RepID=UPI0009F7DF98|nr:phosphonate metabolism transcriptional regulator PhnF [Aurantimonas sp. 22II-16-19i]ORE98571.1 GntR family transcriptional regulator [Aurantimonas sp. 22II-16-19i]
MTLESSAGIARWRQIADHLRLDIAEGRLSDMLPSEARLAERFAVNRHTVRRAIATLAEEGLLAATRGRGTFVTPRPGRIAYPVGSSSRFSENIGAASREPGGSMIGAVREAAPADIAARFGCRIGAPLVRLELLRVADGAPLIVSTVWFEEARVPGIVAAYAEAGSITKALASLGFAEQRRLWTRVAAIAAEPGDAEHLACPLAAPLISTTSLTVTAAGEPLQYARSRFLGSRVELVFDHAGEARPPEGR